MIIGKQFNQSIPLSRASNHVTIEDQLREWWAFRCLPYLGSHDTPSKITDLSYQETRSKSMDPAGTSTIPYILQNCYLLSRRESKVGD